LPRRGSPPRTSARRLCAMFPDTSDALTSSKSNHLVREIAAYAFGGVARIDHQARPLAQGAVVDVASVGRDEDTIEIAGPLQWHRGDHVVSVAQRRDVTVGVGDLGSAPLQELDDVQRRRLAHVVDVAFVCEATDEDLRPT